MICWLELSSWIGLMGKDLKISSSFPDFGLTVKIWYEIMMRHGFQPCRIICKRTDGCPKPLCMNTLNTDLKGPCGVMLKVTVSYCDTNKHVEFIFLHHCFQPWLRAQDKENGDPLYSATAGKKKNINPTCTNRDRSQIMMIWCIVAGQQVHITHSCYECMVSVWLDRATYLKGRSQCYMKATLLV